MAAVRYFVNSVDESLAFYRTLGFRLADRRGPPIAIVKRKGLSLWLSDPGTSARKKLSNGTVPVPGGWNRLVLDVADLDEIAARLETTGVKFRSRPIKGAGGRG